ncbi:MAG: hypothetical protein HQ517_10385 [SAR324 cluster bacterium]|nr:hypothetical protein [SAR324 cluster bacterium]
MNYRHQRKPIKVAVMFPGKLNASTELRACAAVAGAIIATWMNSVKILINQSALK